MLKEVSKGRRLPGIREGLPPKRASRMKEEIPEENWCPKLGESCGEEHPMQGDLPWRMVPKEKSISKRGV